MIREMASVGMPVYNAAATLTAALDSVIHQTHQDLEIIVSDNASTDGTRDICLDYASRDKRVRYFRQSQNIGADANFRFVYRNSSSRFFMWAAADDIRSADFVEKNLDFLGSNPDFVAAVSPVRFSGRGFDPTRMGDRALDEDDASARICSFLQNWHANGRFYSLFRSEALRPWMEKEAEFLASDWALVTQVATQGKFARIDSGWLELGTKGASSAANLFRRYRQGPLDWMFPLAKFTCHTLDLVRHDSWRARIGVSRRLAVLNLQAFYYLLDLELRELRQSAWPSDGAGAG